MSASMRFNFEPETMRDPSGAIKISDRIYRKRQGRRMVFMGLLFIGLVAGLSSQGDGGYFHDIFAAESTSLLVVGVLFLLFTALTTLMGVMQLATTLFLTLNADATEVRFDQTRFGRNVLSATVPVEELDPDVREAIEELVSVLRLSEPEAILPPDSEPIYHKNVPVQVKVLEGGSMKRIAHLTPEKDFVNVDVSIHPEAVVLNGSYEAMRLEGLGVFIPAIPPREVRHIHDLRAMMDSGLMDDWKITRKGFELTFLPSAEILTDFPKAKEVHFILQPSEESSEAMEVALADFKEHGRGRKESFEHVVLALGRRPVLPESDNAPNPETVESADA
jgi:hypothetical protein